MGRNYDLLVAQEWDQLLDHAHELGLRISLCTEPYLLLPTKSSSTCIILPTAAS